jgi:putative hydrolase of the HAD superfamily
MKIRLISFDVWSTLVKANKTYKAARVALLAQAVGISDIAAVKAAMNDADDILDARTIQTGEQYGFDHRVNETCRLLSVPTPSLPALYRAISDAFLADLPSLTEDGLPAMLANLKAQGYLVAVNSNTGFVTADLMREMLAKVGIYEHVDFGLFSDEIGAAKPSPRVYSHLVEVSGVPASEILHVGDNRDTDYNGALASGLVALLYDPQGVETATSICTLSALDIHPTLS